MNNYSNEVVLTNVMTDVKIDIEDIWEASLDGIMVEDYLDWTLANTDVTLNQLAAYVIEKLRTVTTRTL